MLTVQQGDFGNGGNFARLSEELSWCQIKIGNIQVAFATVNILKWRCVAERGCSHFCLLKIALFFGWFFLFWILCFINFFCFSRPSTTVNQNQIPSEEGTDRREDYSSGSIASGSSGFGSLPKKRPALFSSGNFTYNLTLKVWNI